jgi:translation initiation factor IF-2
MTQQKPKKLFKVASEFNVSTQSIVDALADRDFDIDNKPNSKVTAEMYAVLEEEYGVDKQRSAEQARAREAYENRRNEIHASRNESVSVESFLEPMDDLPLEPEEDMPLEPQEEETVTQEEEVHEETEADAETDADSEEETDTEAEDETETEAEADEQVETDAEAEVESEEAKDEEEEVEESVAETKEPEEDTVADKPEKEEAEAESETEEVSAEADEKQEEKEQKEEEIEQAETSEEKEEDETKDTEVESEEKEDTDQDVEEDEEGEDDEEVDEDGETVIRGRAGRLKGTKVLGKVDVNRHDKKKKRKKKKRKRKSAKDDDDSKQRSDKSNKPKRGDDQKSRKKKKKKKKRRKRSKIDESDVEKKMRETMQRMKSSETVGSRRQKRRQQRREEREEQLQEQKELEQLQEEVLEVTEFITVNDLADLLGVGVNDIITTCMNLGMMVSINQRLDASTIELVAEEYDKEVEFVDADDMIEEIEIEEDDPEDLEPRAPIITVMGHVDHGKTSLLDYIRKAKVAAGEAGGITQHVGAYSVKTDDGRPITFLDTPGHEAFTAMRSRGAQATDIVILVVAADDAVMPQTIEAINHAKAAGVSLIVAINKMDKAGANPDKIKQQLAEHDVIVEEYGGKVQSAEISAKTGDGIDELLEKVLIESELMELRANPNRQAEGTVLESKKDKGKGIVANVLVQNGSLRVGDAYVAGPCFGRVRAMEDEHGERLEEAGPSTPVQLLGFNEMPQAGDRLVVAKDEKKAKDIANQRQQIKREQDLRKSKHLTLDDLSRRLALGEVTDLNIIIKADVDGSIEALSGSLQKLSNSEVAVNIIHTGAGAITESDVLLASASDAIIIGFQVRPTPTARKLAESEEIDIRLFSVIYDAVDEVRDALEGLLTPEIKEEILGNIEVRDTFKVPSAGTIAGCYVMDGKVTRNSKVRLVRDGVVIYDGELDSLKRFKDDVKEVQAGYECGLGISNYNDIKIGDHIEVYREVEKKRKLDSVS